MVSVYEAFGQAVSMGNWAALDAVLAADAIDHNPVPGQQGCVKVVVWLHNYPQISQIAQIMDIQSVQSA